jgi:hypothetical protein
MALPMTTAHEVTSVFPRVRDILTSLVHGNALSSSAAADNVHYALGSDA